MPFDVERYRAGLTTTAVGRRVEYREQTGSTMDDARALLDREPDAEAGFACIAAEQLTGRGRLGRAWVSAPGVGLYVTYHLRPAVVANAPLISLAAALAVAEAGGVRFGRATRFQWPNDVMHEGRKLCGILAESRGGRDGVGRVRRDRRERASQSEPSAGDRRHCGQPRGDRRPRAGDRRPGGRAVERARAPCRPGGRQPERVIADWRARLATLGQRVAVNIVSGSVEGLAVDIGARGELVIELADGTRREISSGDVVAPARP